jgi:hypothetical protein
MLLNSVPSPTKNLEQAKLDLAKYGFCLVPEALNPEEIESAKKRLLEQAEADQTPLCLRSQREAREEKVVDSARSRKPTHPELRTLGMPKTRTRKT